MTSELPKRTLLKIGNSYRITIPSDMIKCFGLRNDLKLKFKTVGCGL